MQNKLFFEKLNRTIFLNLELNSVEFSAEAATWIFSKFIPNAGKIKMADNSLILYFFSCSIEQ